MSHWIRKCMNLPTELCGKLLGLIADYCWFTHNTCCSIHAGGRGTLVDVYLTACACPPRCTCTAVVSNHILPDRQTDRQTDRERNRMQ